MANDCIKSVGTFISEIDKTLQRWHSISPRICVAWFRGERKKDDKLRPKLFNLIDKIVDKNKKLTFENDIAQEFRMRAPALYTRTPPYERIDEWLFLMQHNELPTRLLDWTEGALFALFFAINEIILKPDTKEKDSPMVWVLNPIMFNFVASGRMFLPLSWNDRSNLYYKNYKKESQLALKHATNEKKLEKAKKGEGNLRWFACPGNIRAAFALNEMKVYAEKYPIALKPQHIHPRVTAQRSCFTVHGINKHGIEEIFENQKMEKFINKHKDALSYEINKQEFPDLEKVSKEILKKYGSKKFNELFLKNIEISAEIECIKTMLKELRYLGVSYSTLFPELTGLSKELEFSAKL